MLMSVAILVFNFNIEQENYSNDALILSRVNIEERVEQINDRLHEIDILKEQAVEEFDEIFRQFEIRWNEFLEKVEEYRHMAEKQLATRATLAHIEDQLSIEREQLERLEKQINEMIEKETSELTEESNMLLYERRILRTLLNSK